MPGNVISQRKPSYAISREFREYLDRYGRISDIPVEYEQLLNFRECYPLEGNTRQDAHWSTLVYDAEVLKELNRSLCLAYSRMRTDGDISVMEHLSVERVDYSEVGNSHPFRVRIINHFNDNCDHFYVKRADASRLFGLELEHTLSPNRMSYLVRRDTLIEEHIAGVPGDQFIRRHLPRPNLNKVRIAKEFVKFNERCFVRLLGDMRSQNYVVDITPDFEDEQYRVRAIDFDQQSYEGQCNHYFPYLWENNKAVVDLCRTLLNSATVRQYRHEERALIARRLRASEDRVDRLIHCIRVSECSPRKKIDQLGQELGEYHHTVKFRDCKVMGDIVARNMQVCLARASRQLRA